jgi:hypothetical protein
MSWREDFEVTAFFNRLLQLVVRVLFWMFAAVAALALLAVALVVVLLSVIRALITGRRPSPGVVFGRFGSFNASTGMWSRAKPQADNAPVQAPIDRFLKNRPLAARAAGPVVDVEVREVSTSDAEPRSNP